MAQQPRDSDIMRLKVRIVELFDEEPRSETGLKLIGEEAPSNLGCREPHLQRCNFGRKMQQVLW